MVVSDNGGFQVISLLKALSMDWTFFRVKTQDLAMLVGLDDDGVYAQLPSCRRRFWRSLFGVEVFSSLVVLLLLRVSD
jgi:hypothetical protein